jgi:hypothetical protein
MQVSSSHPERQLVSGKVGWGWRQATYPISANFGFAGFLMLFVAIAQLVKIGDLSSLAISIPLVFLGFITGLYFARSVVQVCRQNSEYVFLLWQLMAITAYWLVLVAGFSSSSEDFNKIFVSIWWILPASIFLGISGSLVWRSAKSQSTKKSQIIEEISADVLNIVTYSDQTVLVAPSPLGQQPRQFNSLVLIVLGFFFWTMLDLSSSIRAIAAIAFTTTGLTGFFTWQAQLRSPEKILYLRFSGLWGIAAEYTLNLRVFSRLAVIKLQESNGELSWMQLSGSNSDITIPLAMTMPTHQIKEGSSDQLEQTLREEFHLAKQETERDSLGLAHVLLPQGAGILAGTAFIIIGGLILFLFALPTKLSAGSAIAWLGVCVISPAIARFFLQLVATSSLQPDRSSHTIHLQAWEIGAALLLVSAFVSTQSAEKVAFLAIFNQVLPLLTLICGWLSIAIGVCILAFVRRTPLFTTSY